MSSGAQHMGRPVWTHRVAWLLLPLFAAAAMWLGVVALLGTTTPLEVTDGISMLPTLRSGELAVFTGISPSALRVGDVVAAHVPLADQKKFNYPPMIVHRIAGLVLQGTQLMVQTQGDNHQAPEPFLVPAGNVGGRLLLAIPYVGFPLLFVHSRPGEIALGGLILLVLLYFGLTSVADVIEGAAPESSSSGMSPDAVAGLTAAIEEYGRHLMSHTKVVQELGGATQELHHAASSQNAILASLQDALTARQGLAPGFALEDRPWPGPSALPSRRQRRRGGGPAPVAATAVGGTSATSLPTRRSRRRAARRTRVPLGR